MGLRIFLRLMACAGLMGVPAAAHAEAWPVDALEVQTGPTAFLGEGELKAASQQGEKLPIDAFAMRPVMNNVALSPDGKHLAYISTHGIDSNYYIEIRDTDNLAAKPAIAASDPWEIQGFFWANDNRLVVTLWKREEVGARGYWAVRYASVDANAKNWVKLPRDGSSASIEAILPADPDHVLASIDTDRNGIDEIYKLNVNTGDTETVMRGSTRFYDYWADADGQIRIANSFDFNTSEIIVMVRNANGDNWREMARVKSSDRDSFGVLGFFSEDKNLAHVIANNGEDTAGIYLFDTHTKEYKDLLFRHSKYDADGLVTGTRPGDEYKVVGYAYSAADTKRVMVDQEEGQLYAVLDATFPETTNSIVSRSRDDKYMVIQTQGPRDPGSFYLLSNMQSLLPLGAHFPLQKKEHLSSIEFSSYRARDGLEIPAIVTKPDGNGPFPAVVMPHGGPWARDYAGYDEWAQLLAHHGYLVLQPQFRGSTGFGKKHWMAGDAQWGLTMQDDLEDGAAWLVSQGLTERGRVAIFGWSYGGYAAFVAATRGNDVFQCAVAGAGVSNLSRLRYGLVGNPILRLLQRPTIQGISPLDHVENVNIPMLIIHGDIDQRVDVDNSRDFVAKMRSNDKPHTYIELEDADHFYVTLYYRHKKQFYSALLDYLGSDCGPGGL